MAVYRVDTAAEYASLKNIADTLILVDFTATWCGPCKKLAPILDKLASERPDLVIIAVDIDKLGDIADAADVAVIPCLKFFRNGKLLGVLKAPSVEDIQRALYKYRV